MHAQVFETYIRVKSVLTDILVHFGFETYFQWVIVGEPFATVGKFNFSFLTFPIKNNHNNLNYYLYVEFLMEIKTWKVVQIFGRSVINVFF